MILAYKFDILQLCLNKAQLTLCMLLHLTVIANLLPAGHTLIHSNIKNYPHVIFKKLLKKLAGNMKFDISKFLVSCYVKVSGLNKLGTRGS